MAVDEGHGLIFIEREETRAVVITHENGDDSIAEITLKDGKSFEVFISDEKYDWICSVDE